ncbi:MAG: aminotransferase class III-fold pyridoxal phosphate-dependent enzyme [Gemmatimonadetes bacterium]|nr:aminotransferase class III-fold pyridoxal phosphate-dependent enzyme [Gemmatimonadota bacterium]
MTPATVHDVLRQSLLVDGFDLVLDLERSRGSRLVDARDGTSYLDLFTFFASSALGMNHPALVGDPEFREDLLAAAMNKPSNSDVYTEAMARFVATFARVLGDPGLPHLFFVEGGALAVENALKVAFDWKSRWNEAHGRSPALGTKVLHLRRAFHGRSGYTLSLTNTEPVKTALFPTFDWPRIDVPAIRFPLPAHLDEVRSAEATALEQARAAFAAHPHDIACFVAEPIQGEGGVQPVPAQFLRSLRLLCDEADAALIFDEIQVGLGRTGTFWAHEATGVTPDLLTVAKPLAGGLPMAAVLLTERIAQAIQPGDHATTFGGGPLVATAALAVCRKIGEPAFLAEVQRKGELLGERLGAIALSSDKVTAIRGAGMIWGVEITGAASEVIGRSMEAGLLVISAGPNVVRIVPPLTVSDEELLEGLAILEAVL